MSTRAPVHDDERGATLIVLLLTIIFISLLFGALLSYQSTALNAQTVVADRRELELAGDAALDVAIAQLQKNKDWGIDGGGACTTETEANLVTWDDPATADIVVTCARSAGSGQGGGPREVTLVAKRNSKNLASAVVTLYDFPGAPTVVAISQWDRVAA